MSLNIEDMVYLLRKAMAVRNANNEVHCDCHSDGWVTVWVFGKDSNEERQIEKSFDIYFCLCETEEDKEESREKYDRCITFLEQLVNEAGH